MHPDLLVSSLSASQPILFCQRTVAKEAKARKAAKAMILERRTNLHLVPAYTSSSSFQHARAAFWPLREGSAPHSWFFSSQVEMVLKHLKLWTMYPCTSCFWLEHFRFSVFQLCPWCKLELQNIVFCGFVALPTQLNISPVSKCWCYPCIPTRYDASSFVSQHPGGPMFLAKAGNLVTNPWQLLMLIIQELYLLNGWPWMSSRSCSME